MIGFMHNLALEAGELSLSEYARLRNEDIEYKSRKDIVTAADRAVEKFIRDELTACYPQYDFHGEESGCALRGSDYCWVVDPIDGTASFINNLPFYAISLALQYRGETVAAVIYAPRLKEMFLAERNAGAVLNERRLRVSGCETISDAIIATGFACLRSGRSDNNLKYFNRIMPDVRDIRRHGSAALDLCYVAAGRLDAYWELNLQPYDYAGGILLVTESGGTVRDLRGGNDYSVNGIIATNSRLDRELMPYFAPSG